MIRLMRNLKNSVKRSWEEDFNYFCIDTSKKRERAGKCNCNESKKSLENALLKRRLFGNI